MHLAHRFSRQPGRGDLCKLKFRMALDAPELSVKGPEGFKRKDSGYDEWHKTCEIPC